MARRLFAAAATAAVVAVVGGAASAADGIGHAVGLTPAARGTIAGSISIGGAVFQDETVQTGPSGVLELQFLDETHLALGSSSSVKLDRFVYAGNEQANAVVIGLTRGAFRFATGVSPKKAYRIETPLAAVGVRGTGLAIESLPDQSRITLEHGGAIVCARSNSKHCVNLDQPGDTAAVLPDGTVRKVNERFELTVFCSITGTGAGLCQPYGHGGLTNPFNPGGGTAKPGSSPSQSGGGGSKGRNGD